MAKTNRGVIQEEYRDSDGYWIYLKPGWQNGADPGTHGIVEDTKGEAHRTLRIAKPCDCQECLDLIAKATKNPHAAALGKLGGQATSAAKTAAVRANAKRPRPNARGKKKPRKPKDEQLKVKTKPPKPGELRDRCILGGDPSL